MVRWLAAIVILGLLTSSAWAHTMMPTRMLVSFDSPVRLDVRIDIDLTLMLGSPERYYEFVTEPVKEQQTDIQQILPKLMDALQLLVGQQRLQLELTGFTAAQASKTDFLDSSQSKPSTFHFAARLPASSAPLTLVVPIGADLDFPIAYTIQIPANHFSMTRWLEGGVHASDPFAWYGKVPGARPATRLDSAITPQPPTYAGKFDPDTLSWPRQLALYLQLGFHHIVPEGADHILLVLGLFFLGITWRKLLSQTTVFTIAHATTLFLSTYGLFRLPSRYVEPAIAFSIVYIAIENVFKPRLGASRLAVVFGFGLIHGLGFASSLSEVPFPKNQFLIALLGFNFGVDFGQLFIITLAFFAVGWFRNESWFRPRIAIPCSLIIASVGLFWAIQRIIFYAAHA